MVRRCWHLPGSLLGASAHQSHPRQYRGFVSNCTAPTGGFGTNKCPRVPPTRSLRRSLVPLVSRSLFASDSAQRTQIGCNGLGGFIVSASAGCPGERSKYGVRMQTSSRSPGVCCPRTSGVREGVSASDVSAFPVWLPATTDKLLSPSLSMRFLGWVRQPLYLEPGRRNRCV